MDRLYRETKGTARIWVFMNKEAIQTERPERFKNADQERVVKHRIEVEGVREDASKDDL